MSRSPTDRPGPIVLDGRSIADQLLTQIAKRVDHFYARTNYRPALATILIGDDPASATYVAMKTQRCQRVGIRPEAIVFPTHAKTEDILVEIRRLNRQPDIHGILLQHPAPPHIDERRCFDEIAIEKDVDGVTALGFGKMALGDPHVFGAATPRGIMQLLQAYALDVAGKDAVVVGRSAILGKPLAMMLLAANASVTLCHTHTRHLAEKIRCADIVVGALGKPEFIQGDWIKAGAWVIDAGYHRMETPAGIRQTGDIALVTTQLGAYTPVPGGVGPMTIATLLLQTIESAERAL